MILVRTILLGIVAGGCFLTVQAEQTVHPMLDKKPLRLATRQTGSELKISEPVVEPGRPVMTRLTPKDGGWDCSSKLWILVDIENTGDEAVVVRAEITSKKHKGWGQNKGGVNVPSGETRTLPVLLLRRLPGGLDDDFKKAFGSMRGYPGGHQETGWRQINAEEINLIKLEFFTDAPRVECKLSNLRAVTDFEMPSKRALKSKYSPTMDAFGQNRNAGWDFKINSAGDLFARLKQEENWLEQYAPLQDRSRFGGWTGAWKEPGTDHFRTLKNDGKWWLVDPEGYPFWSAGATGFSFSYGQTRSTGLEELLKKEDGLPGISRNKWNPIHANLYRKYGDDWKARAAEMAHRRLRVWGLNTLGNWSTPDFYALGKTPYTVAVHYRRPTIKEPDPMAHSALPDVFHPDFSKNVHATFERFAKEAADPWCIGFFIDNELPFSHDTTPAQKTLLSEDDCVSRKEFIRRLQEKYGTLQKLNTAWQTDFPEWADLAKPTGRLSSECAADMLSFSEAWYHLYFKTCREAMRVGAPDKLYLGSRINHWANKTAVSICAEYADVVSINLYDYTPDVFVPPEGFDAPVMIGEFHFGTITERGVWGAGLCTGTDIEHAADLFRTYLTEAQKNPLFVGAHWFKYTDQPLEGRKDGENYRIGFVDITDTPYPEMVKTCREVAERMYTLRAEDGNGMQKRQ